MSSVSLFFSMGSQSVWARELFVTPPFALVEGPLFGTGADWGPSVGAAIPGADSEVQESSRSHRTGRWMLPCVFLGWNVSPLAEGGEFSLGWLCRDGRSVTLRLVDLAAAPERVEQDGELACYRDRGALLRMLAALGGQTLPEAS